MLATARVRGSGPLPCCMALVVAVLLGCASAVPEDPAAEYQIALHRGHAALQTGEPDDAADAYRRALRLRPEAPEPLHGIVRCHSARGDGRSALTALARLEASHPTYYRQHTGADLRFALYQAAKQSLWAGDSARALVLCDRLARLEPGHLGLVELRAEAQLVEAARAYVGGQISHAEELLSASQGRRVSGVEAAATLATTLLEHDRPGLAISVVSDAQVRHPCSAVLQRLMERALEIRYPNGSPEPGPERSAPGCGAP